MKVVYVMPYPLHVWTPEPYFYARHMKSLGHEVWVIARKGGRDTLFQPLGISVQEMNRVNTWHWEVARFLRQVKPNVVHVFKHLGCSLLPGLVRDGNTPRFILDIRSPLLHSHLVNALISAKDRFEFQTYDVVCSNTVDVMEKTRDNDRATIRYLPNGIDFSDIPSLGSHDRPSGPFRFVYIGSIDRRRKMDVWLEAFAHSSRQIDMRADFFVRGTNSELKTIKNLLRKLDLASIVRLMPPIPRRELFAVLGRLYDAGVSYLPKEPFDSGPPLKTLEYLACGLPVLATDTLGNRLYVKHELNGLVVKEDLDSVVSGTMDMVSFARGNRKLREICRESVSMTTWENSVRCHLLPIYEGVLT